MSTPKLTARIIEKVALHEGFLKLYRYTLEVQQHGGGTRRIEWELMERGNSVGVLGYDPQRDEIVLGNECRPGALVSGAYPYREQLLGGVLEASESPLDAAAREMHEEAGVVLRDAVIIHHGAYVSSGGTSEKTALVFGFVNLAGAAGAIHGADPKEDVLTVVMPAQMFIERVESGAIDDCRTLLAGYWFARRWPGLRHSGPTEAGANR